MVITEKSDAFGAWASALCLVHCIATPMIYVAKMCTDTCCANTPSWWASLDYIFLAISLVAVYWSGKNTTKKWMEYALWMSWFVLAGVIINEHFSLLSLAHWAIYIPSISLIFLHIYNRKYCQCATDKCCSTDPK